MQLAEKLQSASQPQLHQAIVNAPFQDKLFSTHLGLGIVVLLLVNPETKTIDRIALSDTYPAQGAVRMSAKPFKEITIPLDHAHNLIAKAIQQGARQLTADWKYLFIPDLTPREARFNQAGAGIECSYVYPLIGPKGKGAIIFSYFEPPDKVGPEQQYFMESYNALVFDRLGL